MTSKRLADILCIHNKMENVLNQMKNNSVDIVITDPPYGVREEDWDNREDFIYKVNGWLADCLRVSRHAVIWFGADKMLPYVLDWIIRNNKHETFKRQHAWRKPEGSQMNGASNNNIWYSDECIWVFSKDWNKTKLYGTDMPYNFNDFSYRTMAKKDTGHPTAKPVSLMRKIIGHYSAIGETILDPFAGSFSTAIACIDMGRKCIAIEQYPLPEMEITDIDGNNPDYFNIGVKRIERHLTMPRLFVGATDEDTENVNTTLDLFEEQQ